MKFYVLVHLSFDYIEFNFYENLSSNIDFRETFALSSGHTSYVDHTFVLENVERLLLAFDAAALGVEDPPW